MVVRRPIRLPKQWPAHVKSGVLHAISLASVVLSFVRSRATGRRRLQAELEQANTEIALLREELYIKDGRWERSRSRRRPSGPPAGPFQLPREPWRTRALFRNAPSRKDAACYLLP